MTEQGFPESSVGSVAPRTRGMSTPLEHLKEVMEREEAIESEKLARAEAKARRRDEKVAAIEKAKRDDELSKQE
jgi:hypothetical protein